MQGVECIPCIERHECMAGAGFGQHRENLMHGLRARFAPDAKLTLATSLPQLTRHHLAHPFSSQASEHAATRQGPQLSVWLPHSKQPAVEVGPDSIVGGLS